MATERKTQRLQVLAKRARLTPSMREAIESACLQHVQQYLQQCEPTALGLYWPIKGEIDCRLLAESLLDAGWTLSVPVMNEAKQLDFALWRPDMSMENGHWNIPVPIEKIWLKPRRFLVPLVGFDSRNYRLGYGGGYYDRTLADIHRQVETIGIGMEIGRFDTIHPEDWDIPMNRIITELGIQ